jgi:signal transduction histidine kinase
MKKARYSGMDDPLVEKYRGRFDNSATGGQFSFSEGAELFGGYLKLNRRLARIARISDNYQGEVKSLVLKLQEALANVKELKGYIPICASCKKIRNDDGYWKQLEQYISEHSDAQFSHGLCPDCADNYRSISRKIAGAAMQSLPSSRNTLDEADLDDPVIVRFLPVLANEQLATTPLYDDFSELFQRYVRLTKRMKRIARISDSYQSQLQEFKTQLKGRNLTLMQQVEEETEKRLEHERMLARNTRLAAMGEMIGAIAHQWRQPLATLGATIQSIRMAWERQRLDSDFLERAEASAQEQLYYMSDTIEGFRNFFRPEKEVERFVVCDMLRDAVQLVSAQFANSGITLRVIDCSAEPIEISGYQNEFKQVVLNLASNGRDAILDRRLRSQQAGRKPDMNDEITLSVSSAGTKVLIEVRDTGCGMPPEIAERVFEPYFTTKPEGKGTGIGLYMSRLIIEESMRGHLDFKSGPDGTVFTIELNGA